MYSLNDEMYLPLKYVFLYNVNIHADICLETLLNIQHSFSILLSALSWGVHVKPNFLKLISEAQHYNWVTPAVPLTI